MKRINDRYALTCRKLRSARQLVFDHYDEGRGSAASRLIAILVDRKLRLEPTEDRHARKEARDRRAFSARGVVSTDW